MTNEQSPVYQGRIAIPAGPAREHEIRFTLQQPESRIRVSDAEGRLGGATAEFRDGAQLRNWGAKHAWDEGEGSERTRVFDFDEALPAREICLRVQPR